jgi:putative DNA primase/helicase
MAEQRAPLPPINFAALASALLAQAHTLVPMWLPGGAQRGHEYGCGSLSGGSGSSCSVNLANGKWADFATDDAGNDLVSLYAAIHGLDQGRAAVQVARDCGLEDVAGVRRAADHVPPAPRPAPRPAPVVASKPSAPDEGWVTTRPVPANAPAPTYRHMHRQAVDIEHMATYRTGGDLHGYVVRFKTSDGGKDTLPYTWCTSSRDGAAKWCWRQFDEPRPLYLPLHDLPRVGKTVILVEGEKKADVLQALLQAHAPDVYAVASWPGGSKAWKKAGWAWLAGCTVLLWPDCDAKHVPLTKAQRDTTPPGEAGELARAVLLQAQPLLPLHKQPGMAAMLGIGAHLAGDHGCAVDLLAIPAPGDVPDGWDCADAILKDGWDLDRVQALLATATALPPPDTTDGVKKIEGPGDPGAGGLPPAGGVRSDGVDDGDDGKTPWWLAPYWDEKKAKWRTSRKLVIAALTHDALLAPVLGLNQLSNNIEARVAWPWVHGKAGPMRGTDDLLLGQYLSKRFGLPAIARAALMEAIETVAHARPYHPVREYLAGLQWDGTPRINKWLVHALGESPDTLKPAEQEYLALVGRYWLLGMINRVMEPGCKFDYCPVLEGAGGLGKSTMVEVLAGSDYYSDTHFDVARGKEGQEQVQGLWLYEIAELANFGKAEIGLIKAFVTAKVDRYRPSYGRTVEAYARQCLLVGTTNESTYLRDRTGNRRFWPLPVRNRIKIEWLRKWREQLLAEAYVLYTEGAAYTPNHADEARLFVPMQESRLVETAVVSELWRVLTREPTASVQGQIINNLTDFVTISQLTMALGVDAAKSSPALEAQIRAWLDHEGWRRIKRQLNGVRMWGYERPAKWPPQEPPPPAAPNANDTMDGGDDDAPF